MKLRSRVPSLERFAVNAIRQQTFRHVPRSNLLLTIDNNAAAAHLAQVLWSPDSKRVAVVEDYPRGSGVFAAWFWMKMGQPSSNKRKALCSSRLLDTGNQF
jgi:hypothetical protein